MKQILISLLLLVAVAISYAQQVKQPEPLSADGYRKKAKQQKAAAAIVGITGLVLITGTTFYAIDHLFEDNSNLEAPFIMGCVLTAGSIPLIIISDRNFKKAKKLSTTFMLQRTPPLIAAIKSTIYYPSLSLTINL